MSRDTEYLLTKKRPTNELEHDENLPETKRVSLYGWTGLDKVRLVADSSGKLITSSMVHMSP
jgi:hypothetical protein